MVKTELREEWQLQLIGIDEESDDLWTTEHLIDELHYHLEAFRNEENKPIYEEQAKNLLYRIPIYRPVPAYLVLRTHLSLKLKHELEGYDGLSRNDVLKTAVGRIFENIDKKYFIQSVKAPLKVELKDE